MGSRSGRAGSLPARGAEGSSGEGGGGLPRRWLLSLSLPPEGSAAPLARLP